MTVKTSRATGLLIVAVAASLALGGCSAALPTIDVSGITVPTDTSSPSTSGSEGVAAEKAALDEFVEAAQPQIAPLAAKSKGLYTEVSIHAVYPDTLAYRYRYAHHISAASAAAYFDTQLAKFQKVLDDQVFPGMKFAGITTPGAVYTFLNSDGSTIWTHKFQATK